jgi:single-strand DNA-binding protein
VPGEEVGHVPESKVDDHVNEVRIRGRVSGEPRRRTLPSGDEIVSIRVVVPRAGRGRPPTGSPGARVTVDTIDCVAWNRRSQNAMAGLTSDDHVLVTGALRRRFWRAGASVASMFEIEVTRLQRVGPPARALEVRGPRRPRASDA